MSRVMFVFATLCALVLIGLVIVAVLSATGAFVNPLVDPGM